MEFSPANQYIKTPILIWDFPYFVTRDIASSHTSSSLQFSLIPRIHSCIQSRKSYPLPNMCQALSILGIQCQTAHREHLPSWNFQTTSKLPNFMGSTESESLLRSCSLLNHIPTTEDYKTFLRDKKMWRTTRWQCVSIKKNKMLDFYYLSSKEQNYGPSQWAEFTSKLVVGALMLIQSAQSSW